jgi:hypothetical protein
MEGSCCLTVWYKRCGFAGLAASALAGRGVKVVERVPLILHAAWLELQLEPDRHIRQHVTVPMHFPRLNMEAHASKKTLQPSLWKPKWIKNARIFF